MTQKEFETRIIKLQPLLLGFAFTLCKDKSKAKDLVQDAYVKALSNKEKYINDDNPNSLLSWMGTIIKNTFINEYRREIKGQGALSMKIALEEVREFDSKMVTADSILAEKELHGLIALISPILGKAFQMRLHGYSYKEIAQITDVPIATVKTRIYWARQKLIKLITHANR